MDLKPSLKSKIRKKKGCQSIILGIFTAAIGYVPRKCIQSFPPSYQYIIALRYVRGLSRCVPYFEMHEKKAGNAQSVDFVRSLPPTRSFTKTFGCVLLLNGLLFWLPVRSGGEKPKRNKIGETNCRTHTQKIAQVFFCLVDTCGLMCKLRKMVLVDIGYKVNFGKKKSFEYLFCDALSEH